MSEQQQINMMTQEEVMPSTQQVEQELPVVRENYQEDIVVEEKPTEAEPCTPALEAEETAAPAEDEAPVAEETTEAAPAAEETSSATEEVAEEPTTVTEEAVEEESPVTEEPTADVEMTPAVEETPAAEEAKTGELAMDDDEEDDNEATPQGSPEKEDGEASASEPIASSETDEEEERRKADEDLAALFAEDEEEEVEEDGPVGEKDDASGSDSKPTHDSATKDLYDPEVAKAAKEKARRHAMDADGSKTTALVETSHELVDEGEVKMDDLDWLNEEDEDYTFEDLFPEMDEEFALEDGKAPALAIQDEAAQEEAKEEVKTNAFEEGLERLKRKRNNEEMTPQQAEEKMENLIFKMTTAADEDCQIIRKNMAKERLQMMCQKAQEATRKNQPYLGKKEHHSRFQRLYKYAQFPEGKAMMRTFFDDDDKFVPSKALNGTLRLLNAHQAEPAMKKVAILKHCISEINKPTNQAWFVTFGGLAVMRIWLSPSPDGTLPALSLRTEMLQALVKLPITQTNLRKSKLGHTIKDLIRREDETLNNRKLCQDLVNRWLAMVLDQETSIRRSRAQTQHEKAPTAQPVAKKRKTKQQIAEETKEIQARRHPQMFQKPSHTFTVQPAYSVPKCDAELRARQTRKGKVGRVAGELRALRPATKHMDVSISGSTINLTF